MNFSIILTGLLILSFHYGSVIAQVSSGSVRLGGDIAFDNTIVNDGEDRTSFSMLQLQVSPGVFIASGFIGQLDVTYLRQSISFEQGSNTFESTTDGIRIGPALSYYIPSGSSKFYFPITVYGGYQSTTERGNNSDPETLSGIYYGGNVGVEFLPAQALGLRLSFGPLYTRETGEDVPDDQAVPVNWQVRLGAAYYFTKANEEE